MDRCNAGTSCTGCVGTTSCGLPPGHSGFHEYDSCHLSSTPNLGGACRCCANAQARPHLGGLCGDCAQRHGDLAYVRPYDDRDTDANRTACPRCGAPVAVLPRYGQVA